MKKNVFCSFLILGLFAGSRFLAAEEAPGTPETPPVAEATPAVEPQASVAAPVSVTAPVEGQVEPAVEAAVAAPATQETDNLEFMSGEISAVDETAKTATVKLYGETEDAKSQKLLTVKIDESTDITDGEKDRDLKSLAAGTEVDIEYDPTTGKATYIFVY